MNADMLIDSARTWDRDWGERRTSGLVTSLADLAEQQASDLAAANASILKLRAEVEELRGRAEAADMDAREQKQLAELAIATSDKRTQETIAAEERAEVLARGIVAYRWGSASVAQAWENGEGKAVPR